MCPPPPHISDPTIGVPSESLRSFRAAGALLRLRQLPMRARRHLLRPREARPRGLGGVLVGGGGGVWGGFGGFWGVLGGVGTGGEGVGGFWGVLGGGKPQAKRGTWLVTVFAWAFRGLRSQYLWRCVWVSGEKLFERSTHSHCLARLARNNYATKGRVDLLTKEPLWAEIIERYEGS